MPTPQEMEELKQRQKQMMLRQVPQVAPSGPPIPTPSGPAAMQPIPTQTAPTGRLQPIPTQIQPGATQGLPGLNPRQRSSGLIQAEMPAPAPVQVGAKAGAPAYLQQGGVNAGEMGKKWGETFES